jgi:hypothetical protein
MAQPVMKSARGQRSAMQEHFSQWREVAHINETTGIIPPISYSFQTFKSLTKYY